MERLNALSTSRKLVLAASVLLLIDTFLAWQKVSVSIVGVTAVEAKANAWHGFWGVLLGILTIALVAYLAARTFGVALPVTLPDGLTTLALGVLIFAFALIKNLADDYSAWASYVGVVLAALVAFGAWQTFQESGESLPSTAARPTA